MNKRANDAQVFTSNNLTTYPKGRVKGLKTLFFSDTYKFAMVFFK